MDKKKSNNSTKQNKTDIKKKDTTANKNKKNVVVEKKKVQTKKTNVTENKKNISKKDVKQTNKETNRKRVNDKVVISESAGIELKKLSTIFVSIIGIVCLFYIITVFIAKGKGELKYQISDSVSTISYIDILASDILNKEGNYYVLVKDDKDQYISLYDTYINSYNASEEPLSVYYVDLNDSLNQKYKGDKSNFSKDDLKFNGTTLLKISSGNIDATYSDSESIIKHLKSLLSN